MKKIIWLPHARIRLLERGIREELVEKAVTDPDQVLIYSRNKIFHKIYVDHLRNKKYLLRVITEDLMAETVIISVYRTSKIKKYWRG